MQRKIVSENKKTTDNKFWDLVDENLTELRMGALKDSNGNAIIAREIVTE